MTTTECSTPPPAGPTWAEMVAGLADPRARRGRRYAWTTLVLLVSAALASGQQSVAALAQWVEEQAPEWQRWLPTRDAQIPSAATLRRVLRQLDPQGLEAHLETWLATQPDPPGAESGQWQALAVDGKAVRGSQAHGAPLHLVSAVTHERAQVLAQRAVADKSNEIPAVRALLRGRDLAGWVVTLDALHTQRETAELILAQRGQYLMVVKENQPDLHTSLREWFAEPAWAEEQETQVTTSEKAHGRLERRTLTCRMLAPREHLDWPGARQALARDCWARVLATGCERQARTYAVTSLTPDQADAAQLEAWWRGHWRIENQVHYVRDVTCREDAGQAYVGATPQVRAALCNGLLSLFRRRGYTNMAAAFRSLGASVARTLAFLGCPAPAT